MMFSGSSNSFHAYLKRFSLALATAVLCGSASARAETANAEFPSFSLRGFGTAGLAHSTESKADFVANDIQPNGAGHSKEWSPDVDSRLGVQLDAKLTQQVFGVVQIVSEQRYDGSYKPQVEWANVKYEATPDLRVRVGRIVIPSFMVSDYGKVGYATPWVRAPVEVYSLVPLTRTDGADVSYRMHLGKFKNTIQLIYGESSADLAYGKGKIKGKNARGLTNTLEKGPLTLRASYFKTDFLIDSDDLDTLLNGFRMFGPQGAAIADKYGATNKDFTFASVGGSYDTGKWFTMAEWGVTDSHCIYGKREAWYVSAGYRIDKFTPYATYSRVGMKSKTYEPGLSPSVGFASVLNTALNKALAEAPDQRTLSLGVRWDFARDAALKLQFDHSDIGKGSPGTLADMQPDYKPGGKYNVFSIALDFVF